MRKTFLICSNMHPSPKYCHSWPTYLAFHSSCLESPGIYFYFIINWIFPCTINFLIAGPSVLYSAQNLGSWSSVGTWLMLQKYLFVVKWLCHTMLVITEHVNGQFPDNLLYILVLLVLASNAWGLHQATVRQSYSYILYIYECTTYTVSMLIQSS